MSVFTDVVRRCTRAGLSRMSARIVDCVFLLETEMCALQNADSKQIYLSLGLTLTQHPQWPRLTPLVMDHPPLAMIHPPGGHDSTPDGHDLPPGGHNSPPDGHDLPQNFRCAAATPRSPCVCGASASARACVCECVGTACAYMRVCECVVW